MSYLVEKYSFYVRAFLLLERQFDVPLDQDFPLKQIKDESNESYESNESNESYESYERSRKSI